MERYVVGVPSVFIWSLGDSFDPQPENGWRGVVAINYREGWMDVDTRYRWTRAERLATAGAARRAWMRLVRR